MLYDRSPIIIEFKDRTQTLESVELYAPYEYDGYVRYYVKEGETLMTIANKFYNNPHMWYTIAEVNEIDDIFNLEIGLELQIPKQDG
jgi:nucleoid-associated protein YgaU